jgi:hypothetical protein
LVVAVMLAVLAAAAATAAAGIGKLSRLFLQKGSPVSAGELFC